MNNHTKYKVAIGVIFVLTWRVMHAVSPHNLFEAYNVLIVPYRPPACAVQFGVVYEGGMHTQAYRAINELPGGASVCEHFTGNVLQLWQDKQDAIAALKGLPSDTPVGQAAQALLRDDDNLTHGLYTPFAKLHARVNLPLQLRIRLPYQLTLGCYAAYREISLTDVCWKQENPLQTFDQITSPDFIPLLENLGNMSLRGWTRRGFGDLLTRIELYRTYTQAKPWLQMVGLALRAGVLWPTGKSGDPDRLLAGSLGNGGGVGMHVSGMLQLCYRRGIIFGVDAELLHLFGHTGNFRVKTDPAQTDLFLLTKIPAFLEPGFTQTFTLFGEKVQQGGGLAGTLAYQYKKHSEDILYPCTSEFDVTVINDAESLQEWTAHSFIFLLSYDWAYKTDWNYVPSCSAFFKIGFNGKRSILADTVGFTFSLAF